MSGRFHFRLEQLLRLAGQQAGQGRRALALALAAEREAARAAEAAHTGLEHGRRRVAEGQRGGRFALDLLVECSWLGRLEREQVALDQARTDAARERERCRAALVSLRQQERVLERLRENRQSEYLIALRGAEQRESDERHGAAINRSRL